MQEYNNTIKYTIQVIYNTIFLYATKTNFFHGSTLKSVVGK